MSAAVLSGAAGMALSPGTATGFPAASPVDAAVVVSAGKLTTVPEKSGWSIDRSGLQRLIEDDNKKIDLLEQNMLCGALERRGGAVILDEITQHRIALGPHWRFQRDRLARSLQRTAHFFGGNT